MFNNKYTTTILKTILKTMNLPTIHCFLKCYVVGRFGTLNLFSIRWKFSIIFIIPKTRRNFLSWIHREFICNTSLSIFICRRYFGWFIQEMGVIGRVDLVFMAFCFLICVNLMEIYVGDFIQLVGKCCYSVKSLKLKT